MLFDKIIDSLNPSLGDACLGIMHDRYAITHYHTIPHFEALKTYSKGKQCEKGKNCL